MQFYDFSTGTFEGIIQDLVENGTLPQSILDDRVADVLRTKTYLGLFENPFTDESLVAEVVNSAAHQQVALQSARESIVLLQNNNAALPLSPTTKQTIAVIGPYADLFYAGDYAVMHYICIYFYY
jgi:beta-glucosidase